MSIAFWCVLIVGLLPYVTVGIAKWDKSFDNNAPRDWLAKQEGAKRRAHAAHLNTFEAFPLFAGAVIIATLCHAPRVAVDGLAVAFVVARVLYIWFYITDRASLRSVVWIAGLGISVALFVLAALGA
jgi:uncharacterized MAPEG superfamily protein